MQPLSKLPKRFGLEKEKGYFCFAYNKPENWGLIRSEPPPLSYYVNEKKDAPEEVLAKKRWYEEEKKCQPHFSLNEDLFVYGRLDTRLLMKAITLFLAQSFSFQDLLVKRYGESSAKKSRRMPYFHLFTQNTTIGSYRYVIFFN